MFSSLTRNGLWTPRNISILSRSCSPHLEHLSINLPPILSAREFSSTVVTAVYIHHRQIAAWLCSKLHDELSGYIKYILTLHVSSRGTLTRLTSKKVIPNFRQYISCPTRGSEYTRSLLHPIKNAYKAHSLPAFGKSDHAAIFLTPDYKQRILQEPPGGEGSDALVLPLEATLQASLDDVDRDMFRASSSDVSEFTEVALSFVNTLTEQATETVTIKTFSNQKPWVDRTIRDSG